jgi:hypothetical protein
MDIDRTFNTRGLSAAEYRIAQAITISANDYSHGKPGEDDFVFVAVEALGIAHDDERDARLAAFLFEDAGRTIQSAEEIAVYLHRELTA